jgi:hypothetical protein
MMTKPPFLPFLAEYPFGCVIVFFVFFLLLLLLLMP